MKKHLFILLTVMMTMLSCTGGIWNAIHDLEDKYSDLDGRVSKLEELCKEMNTNISALQTLVSVIVNNDYIVSITPIMKENQEVGYVITFAIHEPITIYHGQNGKDGKDGENGKDGQDGQDGQDGITPVIGVKQDPDDHAYYWTINGEWLRNANGERIPVTSKDGKDGITPQLKIQDGYWYVSSDNGATWTKFGKAVGEDGTDGDSMFKSVTQEGDFVYFTLANGDILIVNAKTQKEKIKIVDGAIMAEFSVSDTKKVYFSQGILLYDTLGTHKTADSPNAVGTWRFADNQLYDGGNKPGISTFTLGSTGYLTNLWENGVYKAFSDEKTIYDYFFDINEPHNDITNTYYDWGVYNAIENGGNIPGEFRLLSKDEWIYLINSRKNAQKCRGYVSVVDWKGNKTGYYYYILPDNFVPDDNIPEILYATDSIYEPYRAYYPSINLLLNMGAILIHSNAFFWTSTFENSVYEDGLYNYYYYTIRNFYNLHVLNNRLAYGVSEASGDSRSGKSNLSFVRLVKDVE